MYLVANTNLNWILRQAIFVFAKYVGGKELVYSKYGIGLPI